MEVFNTEKLNKAVKAETVSVKALAKALNLKISYEGKGEVTLNSISTSRPGLQLTGFFNHFDRNRIQLIGNAEYEYLLSMNEEDRFRNLEAFFKMQLPCVILSNNLIALPEMYTLAEKYNCPLFSSSHTTSVLAHEITMYQSELLAPTEVVHGVLLEVFGVGVLITGKAGIGKSETALDLITKGHRLIADDTVVIKNMGESLIGKSPEKIRYFMEIRGIGIINIRTMYGPGAIKPSQPVDLVVQLEKWDEGIRYDRLGDEKCKVDILGLTKTKITIPVSPGRNIPVIIETAARKFRLEEAGYDATKELLEKTFI